MLFSSGFLGENCLLWMVTNLILYDGMTGWVKEGSIADVACLNSSKAFDSVSHNNVMDKLRNCGSDEWTHEGDQELAE